jgi:hypothetical protein
MIEQKNVQVGNVVDMDVGPSLVATEHRDFATREGLHGEHGSFLTLR